MFDDTVSCFEHFGKPSSSISLINWINTCKTGGRFIADIEKFRETGNKTLKNNLPVITVGGLFKGGRKLTDIISRSGWVAIDIDYKDNPGLPDARIVRDEIAKIVYVAYSGLSVSGKGVWALIKVKDPYLQPFYFEQLKKDFLHLGIVVDPTKGSNPNDARFLSFDPDGIIKNNFKVYDRLPLKKRNQEKPIYYSKANQENMPSVIQQIAARNLNIAPDYDTYLRIGFAVANEYGESGRSYFHKIVMYSNKYNFNEADKQYTECLRSNRGSITIGTLFHFCKTNGIILNRPDSNEFRNSIAPHNLNLSANNI